MVALELVDRVLLLLLDVVLVCDVGVELLDVAAGRVVEETHLVQVGGGMSYFLVAVVDCTLHSLDLVENLDALCLVVLNSTLHLFQVTS